MSRARSEVVPTARAICRHAGSHGKVIGKCRTIRRTERQRQHRRRSRNTVAGCARWARAEASSRDAEAGAQDFGVDSARASVRCPTRLVWRWSLAAAAHRKRYADGNDLRR